MDRALASGAKGRAFESPIARFFNVATERKHVIIGGRAHNVQEAALLAKAGIECVEISIIDPEAFYRTELAPLASLKHTYDLTYLAHGPEEGNAWEPDVLRTEFMPQILSLIDCLQALAIEIFTIHFWIDTRFIDAAVISEKLDLLKEMSDYAAGRGICLCIENLSERSSDFLPAFQAADTLNMTLDIGHGELLSDTNTSYAFADRCSGKIAHVHIHDNYGGDSPKDDLHLPLGHGTIQFRPILEKIKSTGYNKTVTLEVDPQWVQSGRKIIEDIWNQTSNTQQEALT